MTQPPPRVRDGKWAKVNAQVFLPKSQGCLEGTFDILLTNIYRSGRDGGLPLP